MEIVFISMLRHPAEVVGSRTTYYANPEDAEAQRSYATFNVARWVNSTLVSERETRGRRRAFVSYVDLLTDWRPVLVGLAEDLGLTYDVDVAGGEASGVDDFIDPDLRRHAVTWDDLEIPEDLRTLAQAVWDDLLVLQAGHGADADASADLDVQSERYQRAVPDCGRHLARRARDRAPPPARAHREAAPARQRGASRGRRPAGEEGRGDRAHRRGGAPGR